MDTAPSAFLTHFRGAKGTGKSRRLSGAILKEVKLSRSRNLQFSEMADRSESRTRVSVVQSISSELILDPHADRNSLRPTRVRWLLWAHEYFDVEFIFLFFGNW